MPFNEFKSRLVSEGRDSDSPQRSKGDPSIRDANKPLGRGEHPSWKEWFDAQDQKGRVGEPGLGTMGSYDPTMGLYNEAGNFDPRDPDEVSIEDVDPEFYARGEGDVADPFGDKRPDWEEGEFTHAEDPNRRPGRLNWDATQDNNSFETAALKDTMPMYAAPKKFWNSVADMSASDIAAKIGHPGDQKLINFIENIRPSKPIDSE
jgi:hypothetical protein